MTWNGFNYLVRRILTRPKVLWRAQRRLGLLTAVSLARIRWGTREKVYEVRVPQWPHPVYVRGGSSSDTTVLYEILVTDEYEFLGDLGSPGFIIDGGANIGLASVYFLNRYPHARIIAVEPDAETMELCRRNLAPYSAQVTILQGAIWSSSGSLHLEAGGEEQARKVRAPGIGETGSTEAFTLPSLIALGAASRVDLLKLDVEGSEREIFGPDAHAWLPSVRNIVIELHGPECDNRFFSAMKNYDYEMSRRDSVYACRNIRPR